MKTLELKLKKYVLIVEIPRLADYEFINKECKYLKIGNEEIKLNASTLDKFEFLCKGSELTEEIASELVKKILPLYYAKQNRAGISFNSSRNDLTKSAKESFISEIKSKKFHWLENPIEKPKYYDKILTRNCLIWQEAEAKTFKNPLIFVKK